MKRALLIGIDHYDLHPLGTCEHDATRMAELLERNGDGSKNFDVHLMLSDGNRPVSRARMLQAMRSLFGAPAELVLLYFAGHGVFDQDIAAGHLIAQNGEEEQTGVSLAEITALAAQAAPGITSSVIILDCCQAGAIGDVAGTERALLGPGMTILTSCDRHEVAGSDENSGVFTGLMIDALQGSAADIRGNITPAAVYTHVDQSLGAWTQRPVYKANVRAFAPLRKVEPRITDEVLRHLPVWFPKPEAVFRLNPSFEPEADPNLIADFAAQQLADNRAVFAELQRCNRHGLVEPVGADHMYHAAINSAGCRLTELGRHFRQLARSKQF